MITNDRQQEKESMAEFIAKKREMFLVQMSLDTKREEIRKLEEKARMKEEALRKSEQAREQGLVREAVDVRVLGYRTHRPCPTTAADHVARERHVCAGDLRSRCLPTHRIYSDMITPFFNVEAARSPSVCVAYYFDL